MADPSALNQICNELGGSREEALFYLEGFDWNLVSAMEACRIKTLPLAKVKSSPAVSVTEQSTAAINSRQNSNQVPSTPPRTINPRRSSNQNPPKELSSEVKKERIDQFREISYGMSLQEVVTFLDRFNWDVEIAVNHYFHQRDPQYSTSDYEEDDDRPAIDQSYLQRFPENYIPMIGVSNLEGFSQDETSAALAVETMQHRGPPLPSLHLPSLSQFHASVGYQIGSSSSSSGLMNVDVAETGGLHDVPIMSSSQVQIQESSSPAQIREDPPPPYKIDRICNETGVCRDEAHYYLQGFDWDLASAMEACRNKTLPPLKVKSLPGLSVNEISAAPECEPPTSGPLVINSRRISNEMRIQPEQLPPKKEELLSESKAGNIKQFCDVTRVPPEFAAAYLVRCNWNVMEAINYFMEESQPILGDDPSTMWQSSSQWASEGDRSTTGCSEDVTSKALTSENMCPPVPLMGLPSQSQFQASGSSSSSLMNVDPTETEESLKEASDESVPVAIPPMASSQVDGKLKGKAVEEDSSTEAAQAAPNTITIDITFHDRTVANIPFRLDQTVRDIRNVIEALRPDDSRDYYFVSEYGEEYKDLNTTVEKVSKNATSVIQVYPTP